MTYRDDRGALLEALTRAEEERDRARRELEDARAELAELRRRSRVLGALVGTQHGEAGASWAVARRGWWRGLGVTGGLLGLGLAAGFAGLGGAAWALVNLALLVASTTPLVLWARAQRMGLALGGFALRILVFVQAAVPWWSTSSLELGPDAFLWWLPPAAWALLALEGALLRVGLHSA